MYVVVGVNGGGGFNIDIVNIFLEIHYTYNI